MEKKSSWEEALVQLATNTAQFEQSIIVSIQAFVVHVGQIVTMLVNEFQDSSSSNIKKESEEKEEAEAHKDVSCTEKEPKW